VTDRPGPRRTAPDVPTRVLPNVPRRATLAVGIAAALALGRPAHAAVGQTTVEPLGARACVAPNATARSPVRRWPAPLDRAVSVPGYDVSLRDALDRVAASGRFRLSYSPELLPLDRRVCSGFDRTSAGDALAALLEHTVVEAVVVSGDQVVLTPSRRPVESVPDAARPVDLLDRVVVTGSAAGDSQRGLPIALDVIKGSALAQRNAGTLAEAIDDAVPGMWVWEQSPSSLLARYGSIRGASSFGVSYPKIYIDGIEVANPLLVTQFNPDAADHIEVIRGPQGAALYGADAISGVINIVSRHEGVGPDGQHVTVRSGAGLARSEWASGVLAQDHAISLRTGSSTRTASLGLAVNTIGDFIPSGSSRSFAANGAVRLIGARTSLTTTARFFAKRAGVSQSPLLVATPLIDDRRRMSAASYDEHGVVHTMADTLGQTFTVSADEPQSVRQYTLGGTAALVPDGRWTHSLTAGIDGYRLSGVAFSGGPILSATDSALRAARGGADRASIRASSVARIGASERVAATLTFAAEHSQLREETVADRLPVGLQRTTPAVVAWRNTTGLIVQTNVALHDALFATAGVRVERNAGFTRQSELATLPMLGASWVREIAGATLKLRSAYGKGIRPPRTSGREAAWMSLQRATTTLAPEVQAGTEAGADLLFGAIGVHVTRFDQRASGLIQSVAVAGRSPGNGGGPGSGGMSQTGPGAWRVTYELQNVGEIANHGWELQSSARFGPLALGSALSLVDSRVERVRAGYTGDLQPGDRMLEVPARTASVTASWIAPRWSTSWSFARATDWINYDRLSLASDVTAAGAMTTGRGPGDFVGVRLRDYWRRYDGVTRLRANATRDVAHGVSLLFSADNLLNQQRGEPDDVTVVPGRTVTVGLKARF
jgi:iron complex outermembrane receptor protein